MPSTQNSDIIIIGGGMAGLSAALCIARLGLAVTCIDRDDPEKQITQKFDGRTVAISAGSSEILKSAGLWEGLLPLACPIKDIHITDGGKPTMLEFLSEEISAESFGHIIENRFLRAHLFAAAQKEPNLTHLAPAHVDEFHVDDQEVRVTLSDQTTLTAKLLIGADGRNSWVREMSGITTRGWEYGQRAVICVASHNHSHNNTAVEDFRPEGPFAILPMCDDVDGTHRSSIVWTEHGPKSRSALNYDQETFNLALNARFPDFYGEVAQLTPAQVFPLGLVHAESYIAPRTALIADAAHAIHPIAGQGLNIGLRDVKELIELIKNADDPGTPEILNEYQRRRRIDNMAMIFATDTLNKLFSNNIPPVRFARRLGLKMVAKLPPAKRFFMKQAMGLR